MAGYIKTFRDDSLVSLDHEAWALLTIIALRAKRTRDFNPHGLEIGEALIGDWSRMGFSTEQKYREAKKRLEKYKITTCRTTPKGTVAKLLPNPFFDINDEDNNGQHNTQTTDEQRTNNGRTTTNKKERKKERKNNIYNISSISENSDMDVQPTPPNRQIVPEEIFPEISDEQFEEFWEMYPRKEAKKKAREIMGRLSPSLFPEILKGLKHRLDSCTWTDARYVPLAATWLYQERWNDQVVKFVDPELQQPGETLEDYIRRVY